MAGTIGAKIVLDGEKEYKQAIASINQAQKEWQSEMKLCNEQFAENQNSLESLTKKQELYTKQIELQESKLEVYQKAVENSTKAEEEARQNVEKLSSEYAKAEKELEEYKNTSSKTTDEIEQQEKKVLDLKSQLSQANTELVNQEKNTSKWQTSLNNTNAELSKTGRQLEEVNKQMDEAEKSTDGCATSIDQYGKKVKNASDDTKKFSQTSQEAYSALAAAIVGSGAIELLDKVTEQLKQCAELSAEVEQEFKTTSVLFGDVAVDTANLDEQVALLAADGTEMTSIYQTMYQAMSAGVNATEDMAAVTEITNTAVRGSIVGLTDAASAMDLLTTIRNAYNMQEVESVTIMDQLITTQNLGKTTLNELGASMGKTVATASAYKVSLENVESGYISLTKNGIATAEAGTYLSGMLSELGKQGSEVSDTLMEKTGKSFGQLMADGYSLADAIGILSESVDGNAEALMNMWGSQEAGKASNAILQQGLETFNETIVSLSESTGTLDDAYATMTDTAEFAEKRMVASAKNLQKVVGDDLNQSLKGLYETGADVLDWASKFVSENPQVTSAVVGLATAFGTLAIGLGVIAFTSLPAVTTAFTAMTAAMMANPIGLITVAVTSLIAATTAYVATLPKEVDELEVLVEKHEVLKTKIEETTKAYEDSKKEIEDTKTSNLAMMYSLRDLIEVEHKTLADKERINQIVKELNANGLNVAYDKEKNALSMTNKALYDKIQLMESEEQLALHAETMNANRIYQAEIEMDIAEATEKAEQAQAKLNERYEEIANLPNALNTDGEYLQLAEELEAANSKLADFQIDLEANAEEFKTLDKLTKGYSKAVEENTAKIEENISAQVEYRGQVYEVQGATSETVKEIEDMAFAYMDAQAAARDSITTQVGLFEELKMESDLTVDQMSQNLANQANFFNQYTEDLNTAATLVEDGANPAFQVVLDTLMEMGTDGAGYLHELVVAAETDGEKFNELMEQFGNVEIAKNDFNSAYAEMATGYSDYMEEILGIKEEKQAEQLAADEGFNKDVLEKTEVKNTELVSSNKKALEDINATIVEQTPIVTASMVSMVDSMITETNNKLGKIEGQVPVFKQIGLDITNDLAAGITEGTSTVNSAIAAMIDSAVDNADLSGLTNKIDRALGEAMD